MLSLIYLICFLDILGMALLLPVLPVHLMNIGGSRFLNSFMTSLNALLQLISGPLIGSWSDSKGRKPLLLQSLALTLVSNILLLFTSSLTLFVISRIIFGLTCHVQILLRALIGCTVPQEKQNDVFAMLGAIMGLSFVAGPVLGGIISSSDNGFFKIAVIINIFTVTCIGVVLLITDVKPKEDNKATQEQSLSAEMTQAFRNLTNINWDTFWDVFLFKFIAESGYSAFFSSFGIILMSDLGVTPSQMGLIISIFSIALIIVNICMGMIKSKFYGDDALGFKRNLHGFLGLWCTFFVLYLYPSFWTYIFVMVGMGGFRAILDTTWSEILVGRTTVSDKGTIMGSFESVMQMANLLTPLLIGFIGETYGYGETYIVILLFISCGVLTGGYTYRASKQSIKAD